MEEINAYIEGLFPGENLDVFPRDLNDGLNAALFQDHFNHYIRDQFPEYEKISRYLFLSHNLANVDNVPLGNAVRLLPNLGIINVELQYVFDHNEYNVPFPLFTAGGNAKFYFRYHLYVALCYGFYKAKQYYLFRNAYAFVEHDRVEVGQGRNRFEQNDPPTISGRFRLTFDEQNQHVFGENQYIQWRHLYPGQGSLLENVTRVAATNDGGPCVNGFDARLFSYYRSYSYQQHQLLRQFIPGIREFLAYGQDIGNANGSFMNVILYFRKNPRLLRLRPQQNRTIRVRGVDQGPGVDQRPVMEARAYPLVEEYEPPAASFPVEQQGFQFLEPEEDFFQIPQPPPRHRAERVRRLARELGQNPTQIQRLVNQPRQLRNRYPLRGQFHGEKMFYQITSVTQMKIMNTLGGIGKNPYRGSGLCFSMAFLNSQLTCVTMEPFSVVRIKACSEPFTMMDQSPNEFPFLHVLSPRIRNSPFSAPFNHDQSVLFIGNPIEMCEGQFDTWELCADLLEKHVEEQFGVLIHSNVWNGIPQAYANYFGVFIHIYKEGIKGRADVIVPDIETIWEENVHYHVYLFEKDQHIYPIHSISKFLNNERKSFNAPYRFCDYCQQIMEQNKQVCQRHISTCKQRHCLVSPECTKFLKRIVDDEPFHPYFTPYGSKDYHHVTCNTCQQKVSVDNSRLEHHCKLNVTVKEKSVLESQIFVLDIESMQNHIENQQFIHECVLICVRNVYNPTLRFEFTSVSSFIQILDQPIFVNAIFLAHNGGGYDYQFFVVEFERQNIPFSHIPRPSSRHKYLELSFHPVPHQSVKGSKGIRFIDFMMLVPESLKSIGESFELTVQKGDFPHKFLNATTLHYVGPIPPLFSEEDYFGYKSKKHASHQQELETWYQQQCEIYCHCASECTCANQPWDCFQFLKEYCWLDVDVLAEACKLYRDLIVNLQDTSDNNEWKGKGYEPFLCITQSQLAMKIFCQGWKNQPNIYIPKQRKPYFQWKSICWLETLQIYHQNKIRHIGNSPHQFHIHEYNVLADGYCEETNTVFFYLHCDHDGCCECHADVALNKIQKRTYGQIHLQTMLKIQQCEKYYTVITTWDHHQMFSSDQEKYGVVYQNREHFYGGRTEVFCPYANASLCGQEIHYLDVCSMYPYVCSFTKLPVGTPTFLYRHSIDYARLHPGHANPYFGFAKITVRCPCQDLLGLLPSRTEDKLMFHLLEKTGFWHTSEIYLALENGYEIMEIIQVIHFEEDQTSSTIFRGYMEYFLRLKIESEGWKKMGIANPSEEEKDRLCEEIYRANGCIARPRKEHVQKNPVLRKIAKIFLNCLWGKFCQQQNASFECAISSYQEFEEIYTHSRIDANKITVRETPGGMVKVQYLLESDQLRPNKRYNVFIAASVTAEARCILHRQMLKIGPERILYCDTDSIIFLCHRPELQTWVNSGLGNWTDEYEGKMITHFYAIAPKFYFIVDEDGIHIKSKGIWLTEHNKTLLQEESIRELITSYVESTEEEEKSIMVDNMTIYSNAQDIRFPYATMFTRYNQKRVKCVFSKRRIQVFAESENLESVHRIQLFPVGYQHSN
jgi:hypothetical protein